VNWGFGDFQFLKSGSDEPCIQPIESSQLAAEALYATTIGYAQSEAGLSLLIRAAALGKRRLIGSTPT